MRSDRVQNICDLFDDVTDLGAPSSPAPSAHRFAAAGLDRAPKSVTIKIAKHHRNTPLTAASSYKPGALAAHAGICAGGGQQWPSLPRPSELVQVIGRVPLLV